MADFIVSGRGKSGRMLLGEFYGHAWWIARAAMPNDDPVVIVPDNGDGASLGLATAIADLLRSGALPHPINVILGSDASLAATEGSSPRAASHSSTDKQIDSQNLSTCNSSTSVPY